MRSLRLGKKAKQVFISLLFQSWQILLIFVKYFVRMWIDHRFGCEGIEVVVVN